MINIKSIRTKIIGLVVLLGLVLSIFVVVITPWQARELARDVLVDNARLFGKVLASDLALGMQTSILDDGAALKETLAGLKEDSRGDHISIAGIWVFDPNGKPVASLDEYQVVPAFAKVSEYKIEDFDRTFRMSMPLLDDARKTIGFVMIDLSKEFFLAKTASNRWGAIYLAIAALLLCIAAGYYIAGKIGRPVLELTSIAEQIVTGDIDLKLEIKSQDELGRLSQAFLGIINYVKDIASVAERIADNDLTVRVKPRSDKDLLGRSFANMITNLRQIIERLNQSAVVLGEHAGEISKSAVQMSSGSQAQADQVGRVSSAIEEMTATIIESSKNALEASEGARNASQTANTGGQIVGESIEGMQRISKVVSESAESIKKLAGSAHEIGDIVRVIEDIADQTNLLALNAAIEAARAGEQGRGFAVVADEVRKLAERTSTATGEITGKIKGIQQDTDRAVKSMEAGMNEVDQGRALVDKAGDSLNEIVNLSQQVLDMIQQIASASEQQSATAEELSTSVDGVASISATSASEAQKSAHAAEQLVEQAHELNKIVSSFKLTM